MDIKNQLQFLKQYILETTPKNVKVALQIVEVLNNLEKVLSNKVEENKDDKAE
jgi:hypothetical protein